MHGAIIFSADGPLVILTSHDDLEDPKLLELLARKGIKKFIGFPVMTELLRERYGNHFAIVCASLHETDDLRVLDFDGQRGLELLPFKAFGAAVFHEAPG